MPCGKMDAGVAETDPRHGGGQQHLAAGFVVGGVGDGAGEKLVDDFEGPQRPDVADRVGALVGRPLDRTGRSRALVVGEGGVRFEGVTEDVEPRRRRRRQRAACAYCRDQPAPASA